MPRRSVRQGFQRLTGLGLGDDLDCCASLKMSTAASLGMSVCSQ
jgi:hypothetical protein